ncbi:MAG TPA: hypothetical protein VM328_12115 [Fimbriimonadaceae bacterium]|nr:hypothetical protein [Fimbriimonadaceae bacterium]
MGTDEELVRLRAEVERLTQGSAWRERILNFVMAAEADGTISDIIDEQVRRRQEELCRTEDRYMEVAQALTNANLLVRDGTVFHRHGDREVPLEEILKRWSSDEEGRVLAEAVRPTDSSQ